MSYWGHEHHLPSPPIVTSHESALRVRLRRIGETAGRVLSNPTTVAGLIIIVLMVGMALLAPWLIEPNTPNAYQMPRDWGALAVPPGSPGHPLGTTNIGGDVLYGVIWGARTSLRLSVIVVSVTVAIGVAVGSIAGFRGGRIDEILMRIVDVFLSIPELIFALAIAAVLGPSFRNIILALAVVFWVKYARIMRAQVIHVKQNEYVDAARVIGDSLEDLPQGCPAQLDHARHRASHARHGQHRPRRCNPQLHRPGRSRARRMGRARLGGPSRHLGRPVVGFDLPRTDGVPVGAGLQSLR